MNKIAINFVLIACCMHKMAANTLDITNLTSAQISVGLETNVTTIPFKNITANLNPILNDVNEPEPKPTRLSFDNSPVRKLSIIRFAPNMPQIIYYDNQNTADYNLQVGGLKSVNLSVRDNKMIVWPDYVEINNVGYALNDLHSYVVRINTLKQNLSDKNLDDTQKKIEDLTSSLDVVKESDMAEELKLQIIIIESLINATIYALKIVKNSGNQDNTSSGQLNDATQADLHAVTKKAQDLQEVLSLINIDAIDKSTHDVATSLDAIKKTIPNPDTQVQVLTAQAAIDKIWNTIKILKVITEKIAIIRNLQSNLSLGDNNLRGTNKPYKPADDSIDRAEKTVFAMKKSFATVTESGMTGVAAQQLQALQSAINSLQTAIDQMQTSRRAINYGQLLVQENNLQTVQNV